MVLVLSVLPFAAVSARTLQVGTGGGYSDIQSAIDAARDGDTVLISQGVYELTESLEISNRQDLTIRGDGYVDIIWLYYIHTLIIEDSSDITIENLHLVHKMGSSPLNCDGANVIHILGGDRISVLNCELNGCGHVGVFAESCANLLIEGNYIHSNSRTGIEISHYGKTPERVVIRDNRIINNADPPILFMGGKLYENLGGANLVMEGNVIYPGPGIVW